MKRRFHVLVIDDDRTLCRNLSEILLENGYRVDCLSGVETPNTAVRQISPDLLILDISIPGNGLETLRRLKLHHGTRDIPVIVISSESALEYELLDVFDFLPKPLDEKRLLDDLARASSLKKGERNVLSPLDAVELALFQGYLHLHSGLHFDAGNVRILERGIVRRMRALNLDTVRDYYAYLNKFAESRRELLKLLGLLTVGETYFFRYLPHFEALKRTVLPQVLRSREKTRSLRIWSAGCSTGEEPYSLAMLLREHFPQVRGWRIEILGTDINRRALEAAREGLYGPRSLRVTDPIYRSRYFQQVGSSFRVIDEIRAMVRFTYLNLQTDCYPSADNGTQDVDFLFCRNVMIYFRPETMRRIVERFSHCLAPGGFLFLGHSESLSQVSERFVRESKMEGFFYRLKDDGMNQAEAVGGEPPPLSTAPAPTVPKVQSPREMPSAPPRESVYAEGMKAFQGEEFARAARLFDQVLETDPRHLGALVGKGFVLANQGRYPQALQCCRRILEIDDLFPEAYFLQGIVLEAMEDEEGAVREYRRALLLDAAFVAARYNLSRLYRRLGKPRDARRELVNALRILEKTAPEALIPHSGGISREVFMEVCRGDLERQEKR